MRLFGLLCVAAYCGMAWLVAARLLRLASRTGETPELFLGWALLLGGAVGYPATVAAGVAASASPAWALRLSVGGTLGLTLSAWAILLTWHLIYHRGRAWSRTAVVGVTALLFVSLVDRLASLDVAAIAGAATGAPMSASYRLSLLCQAIPYALTAVSGLHYYRLLRRRVPLGLADPLATNGILLWSVTALVVVSQYTLSITLPLVAQGRAVAHVATAIVASLGLAIAVLLVLAFFPPKAYARWVTGAAPDPPRAHAP